MPYTLEELQELTNADFESFKQFIKKKEYKMNTETEIALEKTLETAKKENIESNIQTEYNLLKAAIEKGLSGG